MKKSIHGKIYYAKFKSIEEFKYIELLSLIHI